MKYFVEVNGQLFLFGNYPVAAVFARHWGIGEDKRIEVVEYNLK